MSRVKGLLVGRRGAKVMAWVGGYRGQVSGLGSKRIKMFSQLKDVALAAP